MAIDDIRDIIRRGNYRYSEHAVKRMRKRAISRLEVEGAVISGEIIEEYPDDKYSPSCLILGEAAGGRRLHVLVSLPPQVVVITTYEPDEDEWINFRARRK